VARKGERENFSGRGASTSPFLTAALLFLVFFSFFFFFLSVPDPSKKNNRGAVPRLGSRVWYEREREREGFRGNRESRLRFFGFRKRVKKTTKM
jgi:hypothetical protein